MPRIEATRLIALCAALFVASPACAKPGVTPFVPLGEAADAPEGFVELCERDDAACEGKRMGPARPVAAVAAGDPVSPYFRSAVLAVRQPASPERTRADDGRRGLVKAVNDRVNRNVIQRSDLDRFGVEERWERTGSARGAIGDCEDIALEKRAELVDAGYPADQLFLATVFRSGAGLHTVLIARLDDRDVVLDSLTPRLLDWRRASYSWLRVQTPGDPLSWRRLGDG